MKYRGLGARVAITVRLIRGEAHRLTFFQLLPDAPHQQLHDPAHHDYMLNDAFTVRL